MELGVQGCGEGGAAGSSGGGGGGGAGGAGGGGGKDKMFEYVVMLGVSEEDLHNFLLGLSLSRSLSLSLARALSHSL